MTPSTPSTPSPKALGVPRRQQGWGILETMIVLIIGVAGLSAVMYNGGTLFGSSDASLEQDNLGILFSSTRKLKASSGYGAAGTDLIPQLIAIKGLPNMSLSGTSVYNKWGGAVTITSNGMTFVITDAGLPSEACVTLATKIGRSQNATTSINSGTAAAGEVLPSTATTACSKSGNGNTVSWETY